MWATPTQLGRAGKARVRRKTARRSSRIADKVTGAIWAALDARTVTLPAGGTWSEAIADLAGDLDRIRNRRGELAIQIEKVLSNILSEPSW